MRNFTCPIGTLPIKYLGITVDDKRVRNKEWRPIRNKIVNIGRGYTCNRGQINFDSILFDNYALI